MTQNYITTDTESYKYFGIKNCYINLYFKSILKYQLSISKIQSPLTNILSKIDTSDLTKVSLKAKKVKINSL